MDDRLIGLLRDDVEFAFPSANREGQPSWKVFALKNPAAPVVTISRDPRAGPRLGHVLFAAAPSEETLYALAKGMRSGTGDYAPLAHEVEGRHLSYFLMAPAMYHQYSVTQFDAAIAHYLQRPEFSEVAWFVEKCEVLLVHEGKRYKLIDNAGALEVLSSPAMGDVNVSKAEPDFASLTGLDYAQNWPREIEIIHNHGPFTIEELRTLDVQTLEDYYYVTSWLLRENGEQEFKQIREEIRGILIRRLEGGLRLNPAFDR